jgi:VanZ family protein
LTTSAKWALVLIYTIGIFVFTPFLPALIRFASSRWSKTTASHFVLGVEIFLALLVFIIAFIFAKLKRNKSLYFLLSYGGILLLSFVIYQFLPNPYEFTHLPEYAVLSALLINAMGKKERKSSVVRNPYLLSASMSGVIGFVDEIYQYFLPKRYFTIYDVFLNILGGILGALVFWGIRRQ